MKRGLAGHFVQVPSAGEPCRAFVPNPLPPNPHIVLDGELHELNERAAIALGRLDGLATALPDPSLFIYTYIRKEAVLSSQIEGTQSTLSDLLLFENQAAPGAPLDDVLEVSNYVAAMDYGLKRLRELPLSIRLLKEIHGILLAKGRGSAKEPGEFRRSQNWIGGSRPGNALFVPPPPDLVIDCMGSLEKFLHAKEPKLPLLVKAALAHVQFETIHPFLDGNGRLGRLLIAFLLCAHGAIHEPLLYLSLYLKQNRQRYYDLLQEVRMTGDWETWIVFFLTGVQATAEDAARTAKKLMVVAAADEKRIQEVGRGAGSVLRLHRLLQKRPIVSIGSASNEIGLSVPAIDKALHQMIKIGVVREITGQRRNRFFAYAAYLKILSEEGTKP